MISFEDKIHLLAVLQKALMTDGVQQELARELEHRLKDKNYTIVYEGGDPLPILFLGDSDFGLAFRIEPYVVDADDVI